MKWAHYDLKQGAHLRLSSSLCSIREMSLPLPPNPCKIEKQMSQGISGALQCLLKFTGASLGSAAGAKWGKRGLEPMRGQTSEPSVFLWKPSFVHVKTFTFMMTGCCTVISPTGVDHSAGQLVEMCRICHWRFCLVMHTELLHSHAKGLPKLLVFLQCMNTSYRLH